MFQVVITDYTFRDLAPEEEVLIPAGCSITARRTVTEAELPDLVAEADGVITQFAPITERVIESMGKAKAIVRYGVGYDNVDLRAAARRGIPVCNVPDYCVDEVADHTLALILALTRQVVRISNRVSAGEWRFPVDPARMLSLRKTTVGVVGFGRIGRAVAARLKGFGCAIFACDPLNSPEVISANGAEPVNLDQLLARADIITLHAPGSPETRHLIRAETIAKANPGVLVVNVSRGSLIHMRDLECALKSGRVGGAGLDVTDPEPIPPDSPLLQMENVIITNHVAAYSASALNRLQRSAAETLLKALKGEPLPHVVNGVARG